MYVHLSSVNTCVFNKHTDMMSQQTMPSIFITSVSERILSFSCALRTNWNTDALIASLIETLSAFVFLAEQAIRFVASRAFRSRWSRWPRTSSLCSFLSLSFSLFLFLSRFLERRCFDKESVGSWDRWRGRAIVARKITRDAAKIMQIRCKSRQRRDANPRHNIEGNWSANWGWSTFPSLSLFLSLSLSFSLSLSPVRRKIHEWNRQQRGSPPRRRIDFTTRGEIVMGVTTARMKSEGLETRFVKRK